MATVPLLSREGEVEIAKRIERGKLSIIKAVSRTPTIAKAVVRMGEQLKSGDRTIWELVIFRDDEVTEERIDRLAREVMAQIETIRKTRLDVVRREKKVGTIPKREKTRYRRNYRNLLRAQVTLSRQIRGIDFTEPTYATWWIRQAISRAIADRARTIRIPVHMIETINKLVRTPRALVQELGREPTSEDIAKRMDLPVSKVRHVRKIAQEPISLEMSIGVEEDSHLGDFIDDRQEVSPAAAVINLNLKEQIENVLRTLTPREEKVIKMRFGVWDDSEHTLEEIAQPFAVTRERIRQIEAKALRKLRHPSRSRRLKAFVDDI